MNITAKSVWTNCLKFVKDNIQPQAYKTWFEPIQAWMSNSDNEVRFISALNNENINDLKNCLYSEVRKIHITRFPYNKFLYPDC